MSSLRLGLAFAGDPDAPGTWSGIPAGLATALRQLGVAVEPLNAAPSRPVEWVAVHGLAALRLHRTRVPTLRNRVRVSRTIARHTGPQLAGLRTRALRRALAAAPPLDGVVQLGTEFAVPPAVRVATYEDMTVAQGVALPYPELRCLSERERAARIALQAGAYARAAACCFTTQWAADSALAEYRVPPERLHVVGIGRNHSPRPIPRDWETPRFLFVGSDWERKNGDAVVRAFVQVRERFPAARLDLVGAHPRVEAAGVAGHGWLSLDDRDQRGRLDRLFEEATCFVLPSRYEPSAIAYVEAAAGGIPSIGSTVGGAASLIGDGGCVVDPADHAALLEAMLALADGEAARAAGARALARAHRFTWPEVARRIIAALEL